ncbi:VOC family protein [Nocardioides euryhalodurans]|uniref:VOC family protein n=1 Tax=Nocardioides euryhalodurans TaxID=2518370 RepID=UPI001ABED87D|nr:VOC family protein [Nocardioides euryhalodurans]
MTAQQAGPDGSVLHAEVRYGDAVLMVATADGDYQVPPLLGLSTGGGLYLWMDDASAVDTWFGRAVEAGARSVFPPEDTAWSTRRARVLDPEGHEWSAGTYRPGRSW